MNGPPEVTRTDTLPHLTLGALALTVLSFFGAERLRTRGLRARSLAAGTLVTSPTGNELLVTQRVPPVEPPKGTPVLVFENGMGTTQHSWTWVVEHLRDRYPTVRYDRAGFGASRLRNPRPGVDVSVADLEAVIESTRRGRRAVLVGHSFGGLLSLLCYQRRPDLVAGMVLVDSSHPDQLDHSKRQKAGAEQMDSALKQFPWLTWLGMGAILFLPAWRRWLPPEAAGDMVASFRSHPHWKATAREWRIWQEEANPLAREVRRVDVPLAVVVAGENARRDPAHLRLQEDLRRRSPHGEQLVVEGASHEGVIMRAEHAAVVAEAVHRVGRMAGADPREDAAGPGTDPADMVGGARAVPT